MDIVKEGADYIFDVYRRFPIDVDKGRGVYLYDKSGSCYLDLLAGIAVNALGYHHPAVIKAIEKQLERNLHLSNYFLQDIQLELAKTLLSLTPFKRLFFTNSGTEAVEGLLKAVKKWGKLNNKQEIIAFEGSFHGRSLGALSITIQEKYQKSFTPLIGNVRVVPFNDVDRFFESVSEKTAAVFFEGITGEGGVRPVAPEMMKAMDEAREKYGFLLVADEIQTGVGRTGAFYYYEKTGVIPDAIATAKGLGGGLPLGAFLVNDKLADIFAKGEHGTTYGGNPLACAAGLATIKIVSDKAFLLDVEKKGDYFKGLLGEIMEEFPEHVREIRGEGLMLGLEVSEKAYALMDEAVNHGLIFNVAGGNTLRFVPPLIISFSELDEAAEKLQVTFKHVFS